MMKRWICPLCAGGKLAPSKPRRDDARRYCLACSEKTGRLVERTCPALDSEREARAEAAKAKAGKAAERRKATRSVAKAADRSKLTIDGAYLPERVPSYWHVLCDEARKAAPRGTFIPAHDAPPSLVVARSTRAGYYRGTGSRRRTHLRFGPGVDRAAALELLLHELCHGACAALNRAEGAHGMTFRKVLRAAAVRLWGIDEPTIPQHRYVLDDLIVVELRKKWCMPAGRTVWLDHTRAVRARRAARNAPPAEAGMPKAPPPAEGETLAASPTEG
jgi:hypothetical protein